MKMYKLGILGMALLAGCTPQVVEWSPAESPKENRVDRAVFIYPIPYEARMKELAPLEKAKLLEFLKDTIPSPYAVRITLVEYGGHSEKRLMDIERMLLIHGVPSDLLHRNFDHVEEAYQPEIQRKYRACKKEQKYFYRKTSGSIVELIVERFVVITPSCANFWEQIGNASQAYANSNFGCANEANFGMMIANPQDLLRGRDRDPYDGAVLAAGVKRYENDKIKEIQRVTTTTMQSPYISVTGGAGGGSSGSAGGGGY